MVNDALCYSEADPLRSRRLRPGQQPSMPPTAVEFASGRSRLRFWWAGDRWRHAVITPAGQWESLEECEQPGDDPNWPRSPVLTEVSLVDSAAGGAVLGVGLAGRSHFSLAVSRPPHRPDTLLFEAACRIQDLPIWLGSTYRGADGGIVRLAARVPDPPATACWAYQIGPRGIEVVAGMAATASG